MHFHISLYQFKYDMHESENFLYWKPSNNPKSDPCENEQANNPAFHMPLQPRRRLHYASVSSMLNFGEGRHITET